MPSVAEVIADALISAGIRTVFGIPGGESLELLDALRRREIDFVLTRHEASAVYMASSAARLTRKPSACLATLGPGAASLFPGLAHACLDRAPLLVFTAQLSEQRSPIHTHQYLDLQAAFAPVTKATLHAREGNIHRVIHEALALCGQGRPGPVHLQLSKEAAARKALDDASLEEGTPKQSPPENLSAARDLFSQAQRPLILAGLGLEPEAPYAALRQLAERANAPVITTPKAKGSLTDRHPLAAGVIGLTQHDPSYEVLNGADCVLALGFDVVELVKTWKHPAPLIWLAPWPNRDPGIPAALELVGPIAPALEYLSAGAYATEPHWGAQRVEAHRAKLVEKRLPQPSAGRLQPQALLRLLRERCPDDVIVTTAVGSHKILAALEWPTYIPNSYLVSNGLSSMAFGLPAALAAGRLYPGRVVVSLLGDGSLAMALGELGLVSQLEGPFLLVVFNEGALDQIRSLQLKAGKPAYGTDLHNPSFADIAAAYQMDYYQVNDEESCVRAVEGAIQGKQIALIDALIDPRDYPTAPF